MLKGERAQGVPKTACHALIIHDTTDSAPGLPPGTDAQTAWTTVVSPGFDSDAARPVRQAG
ncbi:hypothetical protein GCM10027162_17470 [Streptomyces incanus]